MKKAQVLNWESYFMGIALFSSLRSKDPKTQNGACIVDHKKRIVSIGYNGLPRGCNDNEPHFWMDEDDDVFRSKHTYTVHAERNAIYNAIGRDLEGTTMYMTLFPCANCTQAIIQTGISRIFYLTIKPHHEAENTAVLKMFKDAGVVCEMFDMTNDTEGVVSDLLATKKRLV